MRAASLSLCLLSLLACGHAETSAPPTIAAPPAIDDTPPTCTVPGVETAHAVTFAALPEGCSFTRVGTPSAPAVITSADDLASVTHCEGGAAAVLDLAASDVYVYSVSRSPAYAGGEVVDDGTTITMIHRDRPPCPDDPMPYPGPASIEAILLPHGATRTFRQAGCSLPRRCP